MRCKPHLHLCLGHACFRMSQVGSVCGGGRQAAGRHILFVVPGVKQVALQKFSYTYSPVARPFCFKTALHTFLRLSAHFVAMSYFSSFCKMQSNFCKSRANMLWKMWISTGALKSKWASPLIKFLTITLLRVLRTKS